MMRAQALEQLGQVEPALEAAITAARFSNQKSKALAIRGYILARAGRGAEAEGVLTTLVDASAQRYVPPAVVALVYAGRGETDAVFEWLDRAYDARDAHLLFLTVDPKWDPFRSDPRFIALLERCGFAPGG